MGVWGEYLRHYRAKQHPILDTRNYDPQKFLVLFVCKKYK